MTGARRWRAALAVLAAASTALAGCAERSRVDPGAPVAVSGTVRAPDGSPLHDRPVRLGGGVGTDEGAMAVLTLGLACTTGVCTGRVAETTTAADGSYRFDLTGRDTQSTFGQALTQLVSVTAAPGAGQVSGAAASARFRVQASDVRLPALDLVDPGLAVDGTEAVVARWATERPGPYELSFEEAAPVAVWRQTVPAPPASVDTRLLEDSSGRVVVSGTSTDRIEGSDVELRWRSPGAGYAGGAGPPPSRGRPCRVVDDTGAAGPSRQGCAATDGDLTTAAAVSACPEGGAGTAQACPRPAAVVVDLGSPVPAELVVVRGCAGGCPVEVSGDGSSYRPAGSVSPDYGTVALDGAPVVAVRVGLGSGHGLREISVWGAPPRAPALRPLGDAPTDLRRRFSGGGQAAGGDRGVPTALALLAGVLAAAVLVGTGFVVGRRRR